MPNRPTPLPASLALTFRCDEALAAGASRRRLRAGDLIAPHRGVRIRRDGDHLVAHPDEPGALAAAVQRAVATRARAYAAVMPEGAFVAGRSAVAVYGLPLERLAGEAFAGERLLTGDEALTVATWKPMRAPRARGVAGMQLAPSLTRVRIVGGLAVTSPASTWAMLAGHLDVPALVRLGDAIVRIPRDEHGRRQPERRLTTVDHLCAAALVPGRRGRPRLLEALDLVRVGSMSPLETDFRLAVIADGLPEPELDVEIRSASGLLLGIADAVYRPFRTIVEVEGDHHRTSREQWNRDIAKHAAYVAAGWEVVRLTGGHIRGHRPHAPTLVREVLLRHGLRTPAIGGAG